jgi:hypothetical protein
VSVTRNFGALDKIPLTDKAIMRDVGLMARERIVRRTRQGQGTDNTPFQPYSEGYKKAKVGELGGGRVNLTVSGAMLNDITLIEVTADTVTIGYKS